ncbi:MAG: YggT family protein [Sulfuricellaceae bacterium]
MLAQAAQFLLDTLLGLYIYVVLLRFYLQLFRAPFNNPVSQFVATLTNFAVKPLRRVIPGLWGMDMASLLLAWIVEFVLVLALFWLSGVATLGGNWLPAAVFLAMVRLLKASIYLLIGAVFIQALLSWVSPYNAATPLLNCLTRPFLHPIQRLIPPISGIDLSPLALFILCELALMLPVALLEGLAMRLL